VASLSSFLHVPVCDHVLWCCGGVHTRRFEDVEGSAKALAGLHGRKFNGSTLDVMFFNEERFAAKQL
jgi:hypothetical protein